MGKAVEMSIECMDTMGLDTLSKIELAGRICYNSEDKIVRQVPDNLIGTCGGCKYAVKIEEPCIKGHKIWADNKERKCEDWKSYATAEGFIRGIINSGHESVIEHEGMVLECRDRNWFMEEYLLIAEAMPFYPMLFISRSNYDSVVISGDFRAFRDVVRYGGDLDITNGINSILFWEYKMFYDESKQSKIFDKPVSEEMIYFNKLDYICTTSEYAVNEKYYDGEKDMKKHGTLTFRVDNVSRATTHQLVRHRIAAYSQRSQRYCGESDFDYVIPPDMDNMSDKTGVDGNEFRDDMEYDARAYRYYKMYGCKKEDARYVLPNAACTSIVISATLNEWKHMVKVRTDMKAQWEIREVLNRIDNMIKEIIKE